MAYRMLAEATMVAHFLFLAFLVGGGFAAWRWPRLIWPHLAAAGWGFAAVIVGLGCPLTWLESWGRRMAGGQSLHEGFVDTYIEGVIYPEVYGTLVQGLVLGIVVVSWLALGRRAVGGAHVRSREPPDRAARPSVAGNRQGGRPLR